MLKTLVLWDVNAWRFPPQNRAETRKYTGLRVLLFYRVTSDSITHDRINPRRLLVAASRSRYLKIVVCSTALFETIPEDSDRLDEGPVWARRGNGSHRTVQTFNTYQFVIYMYVWKRV